jgi:hypothetical protein
VGLAAGAGPGYGDVPWPWAPPCFPHCCCDHVFWAGLCWFVLTMCRVCVWPAAGHVAASSMDADWGMGALEPQRGFSGQLANVAVWSCAVHLPEGTDALQHRLLHGCEEGLQGLWRMASVPDPAVDASRRRAHGVFRGIASARPRSMSAAPSVQNMCTPCTP